MASKMCGKCQMTKLVCDFNKSTSTGDGYRFECKSCNVENVKQWRNNNRNYYNERRRNRYANNLQCQVTEKIHIRLRSILYRGSYSLRTEEILGIPKGLFLDWLSFNFEGEMCFGNYGKLWCIDLVTPASSYDLTNEQQLLAAFNWRNMY